MCLMASGSLLPSIDHLDNKVDKYLLYYSYEWYKEFYNLYSELDAKLFVQLRSSHVQHPYTSLPLVVVASLDPGIIELCFRKSSCEYFFMLVGNLYYLYKLSPSRFYPSHVTFGQCHMNERIHN